MTPIRTQIANAMRRHRKAMDAVKASRGDAREEALLEQDDARCEMSTILSAYSELFSDAQDTKRQLAAVTKERDELREALANCEAWSRRAVTTQECVVACQQIMNEAAAALQPGDDA